MIETSTWRGNSHLVWRKRNRSDVGCCVGTAPFITVNGSPWMDFVVNVLIPVHAFLFDGCLSGCHTKNRLHPITMGLFTGRTRARTMSTRPRPFRTNAATTWIESYDTALGCSS